MHNKINALLAGLAIALLGGTIYESLADTTQRNFGAAGAGVAGPASSVDAEIVLFDGTGGATLKRATGTGVVHATSGVYSASNVALGSEVSGTLPVANGGTNLTAAADDNVMIGNATTWQTKAIPDCDDSSGNHLNYDTSTNALSCGTSSSGGGATDGVFAPTCTAVSNVTGSVCTRDWNYARVGNTVIMSGTFTLDPTAAANTQLDISVPIASNFTDNDQASGVCSASGIDESGAIVSDAANNRLSLLAITTSGNNDTWGCTLTYQVL